MKDQTLFNRVARHLLKQGRRSVARIDGETHCRYRGDNGLKCAIGCLIPNVKYSEFLEGKTACDALVQSAAGIAFEQEPLARELQNVHDREQPSRWVAGLRRISKEYNLDASVLNDARS